MRGRATDIWWGFLAVLLLLAVWLACTGHALMYGFPLAVVESLARGQGLLPPQAILAFDGVELLGRLPGDRMAWAGGFTAGLNCLAATLLYVVLRRSWRNPIGPVLAVGAAFFGANTLWVQSVSPADSLLHLLLAASIAALVLGAVPVLAGLALATALLSPADAVMLFLALAYLSYRRAPVYGLPVSTLAVFGVGCLLIPLAGVYRLQPGFAGWQLWSLLPLALALVPSTIRSARGGIYLSLLLGSWLTGAAELATVLALGDLAFVAIAAISGSYGDGLQSAEQSSQSAEQPSQNAEQPLQSAEQPSRSAEQPSLSAEQPSQSAEQPSLSAEQSLQSAEQPAQSAGQPSRSAEQPSRSAGQHSLNAEEGPHRPAQRPSSLDKRPQSAQGWSVSGSLLGGFIATVMLVSVVLPGERYLNREVLIPSGKAKVPLGQLFGIFSLTDHAKRYADQPWRARAPFPTFGAADCELALDLGKETLPLGLCPVTVDSPLEDRTVGLLYAMIANRPLTGWDDPQHLSAPLLLCKLRAKNFLVEGPALILRGSEKARLAKPAVAAAKPAPLDFRSIITLPYRPQELSQEKGGAYRWHSAGESYALSFTEQNAEVILSDRPGEYRMVSLAESKATRVVEVSPTSWEIVEVERPSSLPSRSLVPLSLRLKNKGLGPVSSDQISSWRLQTVPKGDFSPFSQNPSQPFILYPGETVSLSLQVATPEAEGIYALKVAVDTPSGETLDVPLAAPVDLRTWRRLPPVGTWVEKP